MFKGFTLIEVALAVAVGLIIIGGVALGFNAAGQNKSNRTTIITYDGGRSQTFFVERYEEKNGGIEFEDWQGRHRFTSYTVRDRRRSN